MRLIYDIVQVRQQLDEKVRLWYGENPGARRGGMKAIADKIGVDRRFLKEIIVGESAPSPKVLTFLGLEKKVVYVTPDA